MAAQIVTHFVRLSSKTRADDVEVCEYLLQTLFIISLGFRLFPAH